MELIIKIALGIVLGYAIIVNHAVIWRWSKVILITLVTCIVLGYVAYFAVTALSSAADQLWGAGWTARFWPKLGQLAFVLVWFGLVTAGFAAFSSLMSETVPLYRNKAEPTPRSHTAITAFIGVVFFITPWLIWFIPPFDQFYAGVDRWSRDNGHFDTGSMALIGITFLWPIPILIVVKRLRGKPAFEEYPENDLENRKAEY